MKANYPIHPDLPSWSLSSTHSQLYDQLEATLVTLEIYERCLDSLIKEYDAVKDELKAGEVGLGSLDVRAAFSQLAALAATFCQKSKDKDQKKEVSDTHEAKQASHTELQMQAAKVQKELSDMRAAGASAQRQSRADTTRTVMKQVAELQPAFSAHLKLSGTDFDRWCKEMRVWSTASHFNSVENTVQAAFASKHTEVELEEKIRDKALREGVDLTFEAYVQLASAIFREQSSIFPRSVVWNSFNSVPRIPPQKDCCNTCQSSKWNSKQPKFPGYSTPQTLQPTR